MSSVNISITEEVYDKLKALKKKDESFSEIISSLVSTRDISKCYGLLKDYPEELDQIEKEAIKSRKAKWREIKI
ncbi:hypothetical protein HZC07_04875 [Candidatus Micrarchaeota archaeon]|nr:hypothetical protein [Candidatus Micrarchaeota archaeon]